MRYAIDCEFIDTPSCSALISLAIVREDGASRYFEFDYPESELTPWLRENVVPHLCGPRVAFKDAAESLAFFIDEDDGKPEIWGYFGAYDWYWLCRLFGGLMAMPDTFPHRYRELAEQKYRKPVAAGAQHNALADARGIMQAVLAL